MSINQLTSANTFGQWLSTTQALVALANTLTDGNGATFTANTILSVSGTGSYLNVANVTKTSTILFYDGTTLTSNIGEVLAYAAFNKVNSASSIANTDFTNISATAGTYGNASITPVFTVAANGRISSISNTTLSISDITGTAIRVSGTNVGFGTGSPAVQVHATGVGRFSQMQMPNYAGTYTSGSAGFHLFGFSDNNLYFNWFDAGSIIFRNNGINERMRITAAGNVGIGNTSPAFPFTVVGGRIQLSGGTSSQEGIAIQRSPGVATISGINNDNNSFNDIGFFTTASESLRISSGSGFVGIGTTTPSANLDVSGTVNFSKANYLSQTLTDGATINWNTISGVVATVTLSGNRTMAAPTNLKVGTYILHVLQDGSGNRTLTWNSVFKWSYGTAPVLSTGANKRDVFSFICDGTNLYGSYMNDVR